MEHDILIGLAAIPVLGISAQWLAWRLRIPAILPLLICGFLAGPATGWLKPDEVFGDLLLPIVSLSVGLILFEGGLSLKRKELTAIGAPLRNLITIGAVVTWLGTAAAAHWIAGLPGSVALLLGAVLVVTGPTVIVPLLRQVRPAGMTGPLLKWEGILIDPIGASLALLVFEAVFVSAIGEAPQHTLTAVLRTLAAGGVTGVGAAIVLTAFLRRYWIPDYLQNAVTIMFVVGVFAISNVIQEESGLLAVTLMGIYIANQSRIDVSHIVEFKENIRVLLISGLFIVLAATLDVDDFRRIPASGYVFLGVLLFAVRPASVFLSTIGTSLTTKEKVFLSWMAPRGIVAAAVSSVFGLRLAAENIEGAEFLVPMTFLVIAGTVTIYGLTAVPLARMLQLSQPNPSGVLFVGAQPWARAMASALKKSGVPVILADTNYAYASAARLEGLRCYHGNALSDQASEEMDLSGVGNLIAATPNDAVNSMAAVRFADELGRGNVYQIAADEDTVARRASVAKHLRGRVLFGADVTFDRLNRLFDSGATVARTELTEETDLATAMETDGRIPLALVSDGRVRLMTAEDRPKARVGDTLLSLEPKPEDAEPVPGQEKDVTEPEEA